MTGRQSVLCAVERMLWRGVFVALAAVFLTVLLPVLWDLLSPFLIGLAVAALLRPLIALTQEKTHMRRGLAVGLWVALAVLAAMWLAYWICSFVVVQLAVATPGVVTGVVDMLRVASERLLDMAQALPSTIGDTLRTSLNGAFQSLSEAGMQFAGSVVNGALSVVASLPYAFVYANFLLLAVIFITNRYEKWRKFLAGRRLFGGERSIRLLRQSAGEGLAGYIRVQLLFSLLALLISWVFFQAVGFEYAFLIGFAAALLELIPQFGCGVMYIPWGLVCFVVGTPHNGWLVLGLYAGYSLLRRVTEPALLGTNLGVSPLASLIGMFVGMRLGGVAGLILGPIVMVVLAGAVRAHLFDGIMRDAETIAVWMTQRWHRDEGEGKHAAG